MNGPYYDDGPGELGMYVRAGGRFWWLVEILAFLVGAVLVAAFEVSDAVQGLVKKVRRG